MDPGTLNFQIKRGVSFGPARIICRNAAGEIVPLAGWQAYAHMRKSPDDPVLIDFNPQIASDDADGLVTLPVISYAITADLTNGVFFWDLILQTPDGRRLDPSLSGTVTVATPLTQPGTA